MLDEGMHTNSGSGNEMNQHSANSRGQPLSEAAMAQGAASVKCSASGHFHFAIVPEPTVALTVGWMLQQPLRLPPGLISRAGFLWPRLTSDLQPLKQRGLG